MQLPDGETQIWLEDGDRVTLKGWCEKPGAARIGFGECVGMVVPAQIAHVDCKVYRSAAWRIATEVGSD